MSDIKELIENPRRSERLYARLKGNIITLCGSTRFEQEYHDVAALLTMNGYCVISCCVFKSDIPKYSVTEEDKVKLDQIHKQKILLSDKIVVIDQDNYIGNSTKNEIEFCKDRCIPVYYYKGLPNIKELQIKGDKNVV